jgi:hypothetical protein
MSMHSGNARYSACAEGEGSELSVVRAGWRAQNPRPRTGSLYTGTELKARPGGPGEPVRDQIPPQSKVRRRTSIIAMGLAENPVVGGLRAGIWNTPPEPGARCCRLPMTFGGP